MILTLHMRNQFRETTSFVLVSMASKGYEAPKPHTFRPLSGLNQLIIQAPPFMAPHPPASRVEEIHGTRLTWNIQ